MNLASLSIKRPVFITCVFIAMLAVGWLSMRSLGVDLFPNITFPVVTVSVPYPGAGPKEIETLVSKVLEDELSTVSGVKRINSISKEGIGTVVAEFTLETDVKFAEQQIKDRVNSAKRKLPTDILEPIIKRIDPADQPVLVISVEADLPAAEMFDLANEDIRPKIEQVNRVGLVDVIGGRKREILVELDRAQLKDREISASMVAARIAASGQNIPLGKINDQNRESVFRALGEFQSLEDIQKTIVNFLGNDVPVAVGQVGRVVDGLQDEMSRGFVNGKPALFLFVFRQSGANTIRVATDVRKRVDSLNQSLSTQKGAPKLTIVRDSSKLITANVADVQESIVIGIILTILVVWLFLGSGRSTIITGMALPNSLMGAFILMSAFGFTINVMTLLALSLCVGLLVDDAIVVRENIFRHLEMGKSPIKAALDGTNEVTLAVIATTFAVLAVFGPIGFLQGVVGQFFKEFGLTICFAIMISLLDAFTMAPMMSAYFAGKHEKAKSTLYKYTMGAPLAAFEWFQVQLERGYAHVLRFTLRFPSLILITSVGLFVGSIWLVVKYVPKTFLSPQDLGEFVVGLDMPPGTGLPEMSEIAQKVDKTIRSRPEVAITTVVVGNRDGQPNVAEIFVQLVPYEKRPMNTSDFKDIVRKDLAPFKSANPLVKDIDMVAGGLRPFSLNIVGDDFKQLEEVTQIVFQKLKDHPALKDVDISHRPGKPEVQFIVDRQKAERLGVSTNAFGAELRTLVEGATPAVYRQEGREYDIRVRLQEDQRNLKEGFSSTWIPNINMTLLKASNVATLVETEGPANINRQDRGRYIQISADIAPDGPGLGKAMSDVKLIMEEIKLPPNMRYAFIGQAESFQELIENMIVAVILSIIFIYLVLASLYESFVTPVTIMLVLPLAAAGAFAALFVTGKALDLNSMIGCILLMGVASKNSILLVDYANQQLAAGMDRAKAMMLSGQTRLRPILMTSFALIAGMLPIAIGLNEASRQRTSMGVAVIGGLISSTLLTLVVIPAAWSYIDRFREWSLKTAKRLVGMDDTPSA
jgi:HAE1 family hydrophobic/amphiphilic exporter-1